MKKFNEILCDLMKEYDIEQKDLAARTGLTQATISRYATGKMIPTGENLVLLADVFNVSIDYLLGRTDVRAVNKRKKEDITTLAAHKTDLTQGIKNIDGLKDLLREIVKEELGK